MKILLVFGLSLAFTSHSYTDSMSFFERGGQACSQHTIALCAPVYGSANGYVDCTHTLAFQHLFAWAKCVDLCKQCVRASLAVTVCECIEIVWLWRPLWHFTILSTEHTRSEWQSLRGHFKRFICHRFQFTNLTVDARARAAHLKRLLLRQTIFFAVFFFFFFNFNVYFDLRNEKKWFYFYFELHLISFNVSKSLVRGRSAVSFAFILTAIDFNAKTSNWKNRSIFIEAILDTFELFVMIHIYLLLFERCIWRFFRSYDRDSMAIVRDLR